MQDSLRRNLQTDVSPGLFEVLDGELLVVSVQVGDMIKAVL